MSSQLATDCSSPVAFSGVLSAPADKGQVRVDVWVGDRIDGVADIADAAEQELEPSSSKSSGKKRLPVGNCLDDDLDDCQRSSGSASQNDFEEEDKSAKGRVHEAMNYFAGISTRIKDTHKRLLEWDDDIDETAVNYLESEAAVSEIKSHNRKLFPQIYLFLHQQFNVILYGFGSKRNLLNNFASTFLKDEHYLMINGYFPALTTKDVANHLKDALKAESSESSSLFDAVDELAGAGRAFYLVIHSIDILFSSGNNSKIKSLILDVIIQGQGSVRLIATVDHVNSGLLFNSSYKAKMDLTWVHVPTYNPYTIERGYAASGDVVAGDSDLTLSSVIHVYESLTPNAQKIFLQILDYYVDNKKRSLDEKAARKEEAKRSKQQERDQKQPQRRKRSKKKQQEVESSEEEVNEFSDDNNFDRRNAGGDEFAKTSKSRGKLVDDSHNLPFSVLYRICREQYLVNSETTLKAQLIEFQDHNIMRVKKSSDGAPVVRLLVTLELSQTFLNKIRDV